uniref:Uncharacterized protein n=1 Tax=Branchiostoma floridae TaxID=7739 RepID=C3YFU6_BRAFL|eukprot:XP_002604741.1 hypothetical protein BRAFLDRAFT_80284 [Branchiostoma floridae]
MANSYLDALREELGKGGASGKSPGRRHLSASSGNNYSWNVHGGTDPNERLSNAKYAISTVRKASVRVYAMPVDLCSCVRHARGPVFVCTLCQRTCVCVHAIPEDLCSCVRHARGPVFVITPYQRTCVRVYAMPEDLCLCARHASVRVYAIPEDLCSCVRHASGRVYAIPELCSCVRHTRGPVFVC